MQRSIEEGERRGGERWPPTGHSPSIAPVVERLDVGPVIRQAAEAIRVEAVVGPRGAAVAKVDVLYRVIDAESDGDEVSIPMKAGAGGRYRATIPGQQDGRLVRVRIRAMDVAGATRLYPHPFELRPAESIWFDAGEDAGKLPVARIVHFADERRSHRDASPVDNARERDRPDGAPPTPPDRPRPEGRFGPDRDRGFGRGPDFGRNRGFGPFGSAAPSPVPAQGRSALIFSDPGAGKSRLFDFIHVTRRKSGYKLRLQKDRPLDGMTTLNVIYEQDERSILTEAPAYELYRLAGNPTPQAGYLRLIIDGRVVGYHLWFEQPNGAFFGRNDRAGGNLYKVIWQGSNEPSRFTPRDEMPSRQDIVGRHEKKTHPHDGYGDLIELVESLERTDDPDALWKFIEERFEVGEVINYFAVNTLLSHWDGFFNNYFLYHDVNGSGKWTMLPWDQDSTWGHRMGRRDEVFAEMPLSFGMEGDTPPGSDRTGGERGRRGRGGFGGFGFGGFGGPGAAWWRSGGEISRPLLANPGFRRRFLERLVDLAKTIYTEDVWAPKFEKLRDELVDEVKQRAETAGRSGDDAIRGLDATLAFFRKHLIARRAYILEKASDELRAMERSPSESAPDVKSAESAR